MARTSYLHVQDVIRNIKSRKDSTNAKFALIPAIRTSIRISIAGNVEYKRKDKWQFVNKMQSKIERINSQGMAFQHFVKRMVAKNG